MMRTTAERTIWTSLLMIILAALCPGGAAIADVTMPPIAKAHYVRGIAAFKSANLPAARDEFIASVQVQQHSHAAYYLGVTFARLGDHRKTGEYIQDAQRWKPALDKSLQEGATQMLTWAKENPEGETFLLAAKADGFQPQMPDEELTAAPTSDSQESAQPHTAPPGTQRPFRARQLMTAGRGGVVIGGVAPFRWTGEDCG